MQEVDRTKRDSAEIGVQKTYKPSAEIISQHGYTLPNGLQINFTIGRLK